MTILRSGQHGNFVANMTNPSRSLVDAFFYAGIVGSDDATFNRLHLAYAEVGSLGDALFAEGVISEAERKLGFCDIEFERVAQARAHEDPRFARIVELSRLRLLVQDPARAEGERVVERVLGGELPGVIVETGSRH